MRSRRGATIGILVGAVSAGVPTFIVFRPATVLAALAGGAVGFAVHKIHSGFNELKCLIGRHHWEGCKCTKCGKTRDEGHDWATNCAKCARCGKTRDVAHDWKRCKCTKCELTKHMWEGCKCTVCGAVQNWGHGWDMCLCVRCGTTRDHWDDRGVLLDAHKCGDGYVCLRCGKIDKSRLVSAAWAGDTATVAALLAKGVDVNTTAAGIPHGSPSYNTALIAAATQLHPDVVRLLLESNANVNATDKYGGTALACASSAGKYSSLDADRAKRQREVVKLLLSANADVNAKDAVDVSVLHSLVSGASNDDEQRIAIIKSLVNAGADVNEVDGYSGKAIVSMTSSSSVRSVLKPGESGRTSEMVNEATEPSRHLRGGGGELYCCQACYDKAGMAVFQAGNRGDFALADQQAAKKGSGHCAWCNALLK